MGSRAVQAVKTAAACRALWAGAGFRPFRDRPRCPRGGATISRTAVRKKIAGDARPHLATEGEAVIGIDDTIERRWWPRIKARGTYRDPVRSSKGHFVKTSGLRRSWSGVADRDCFMWIRHNIVCPSSGKEDCGTLRGK